MTYHPEGGGESSLQLRDPAANETILTGLQCDTRYTITVVATAGEHRRESAAMTVLLPLVQQGIYMVCVCEHTALLIPIPAQNPITAGPHNLSATVLFPTSMYSFTGPGPTLPPDPGTRPWPSADCFLKCRFCLSEEVVHLFWCTAMYGFPIGKVERA